MQSVDGPICFFLFCTLEVAKANILKVLMRTKGDPFSRVLLQIYQLMLCICSVSSYCNALYFAVLCCAMMCCVVPCCVSTVRCGAVRCYVVLYYAVLCRAVSFAMLCCAVLCSVVLCSPLIMIRIH